MLFTNAQSPIDVMFGPRDKYPSILEQPKNARAPIGVMELGNLRLPVMLERFSKADSPIILTPSAIVSLEKLRQS